MLFRNVSCCGLPDSVESGVEQLDLVHQHNLQMLLSGRVNVDTSRKDRTFLPFHNHIRASINFQQMLWTMFNVFATWTQDREFSSMLGRGTGPKSKGKEFSSWKVKENKIQRSKVFEEELNQGIEVWKTTVYQ